ncbi:DNA adenine methylase [Paenibacillus sp. Dod16]|uniref:DNA adenine methylase n=1 Tax=Paenibacillus sp. Dod16 TaxID=3416392 RepID=UPI003CE78783
MILTCQNCETTYDPVSNFQPDKNENGFWCDACEYFNYFDASKERPPFILFLESSASVESPIIQKPKVKLKKQLSPLRYPGGKSKIADQLLLAMRPEQLDTLISVYAGGASVELALLDAKQINNLVLNDLDFGIYSLYYLIKHHPDDLIHRIKHSDPTHDEFFKQREIIKNDYDNVDMLDAAWAMLLVNRLAYSGIYKANPLGGKKGSKQKLLSRFNPDVLCRRISHIHGMSDRIVVQWRNAVEFIEEYAWYPNATLYLDPPYFEKGHSLYRHFYSEEQHIEVCELLNSFYEEFPNADFVVTYDNHPFIRELYDKYATRIEVNRRFSA